MKITKAAEFYGWIAELDGRRFHIPVCSPQHCGSDSEYTEQLLTSGDYDAMFLADPRSTFGCWEICQ